MELNKQTDAIKRSYLNIVALFLEQQKIESRYLRCLLRWGFELNVTPEDLFEMNIDFSKITFSDPGDKIQKVESIYHLVHMICLDRVVEDVELEIASIYASKLGFKPSLIGDLVKSIVTADTDGAPLGNVRQQVTDFLSLYDQT